MWQNTTENANGGKSRAVGATTWAQILRRSRIKPIALIELFDGKQFFISLCQ